MGDVGVVLVYGYLYRDVEAGGCKLLRETKPLAAVSRFVHWLVEYSMIRVGRKRHMLTARGVPK